MSTEVLVFGGAGIVTLFAFTTLILAPAMGSFSRGWEKATAVLLSVIVLITLVGIGIALGLLIIYNWDEISGFFD